MRLEDILVPVFFELVCSHGDNLKPNPAIPLFKAGPQTDIGRLWQKVETRGKLFICRHHHTNDRPKIAAHFTS